MAEDSIAHFAHFSPLATPPKYVSRGPKHAISSYLHFLAELLGSPATTNSMTQDQHAAKLKADPLHSLQIEAIEGSAVKQNKHEQLQRILLVLKLASLLACVRYHSTEAELAERTITLALADMVQGYSCNARDSHQGTAADSKLWPTTVVGLAEMTVPLLRQRAAASAVAPHAGDSCLQLVEKLLSNNQCASEIASVLVKQGACYTDGHLLARLMPALPDCLRSDAALL